LSQTLVDQLLFGYLASYYSGADDLVYDSSQPGRVKSSLCRAEFVHHPCDAGVSMRPLAKLVVDALAGALPFYVLNVSSVIVVSINVDMNLRGSRHQHPHWDEEPDNTNHYLFVPLVDMDDAIGPIEVWPGTHTARASVELRQDLFPHLSQALRDLWDAGGVALQRTSPVSPEFSSFLDKRPHHRVLLRAGEAIAARPSIWHRGTPNMKHIPRPMLTVVLSV